MSTPPDWPSVGPQLLKALEDTTVHLIAATSLLSRSSKKAAPSNKMFDQMLIDYNNSAARGRAAIAAAKKEIGG